MVLLFFVLPKREDCSVLLEEFLWYHGKDSFHSQPGLVLNLSVGLVVFVWSGVRTGGYPGLELRLAAHVTELQPLPGLCVCSSYLWEQQEDVSSIS